MGMKKVKGQLTADMFAKYEKSVRHFVPNDQSFLFMNQIKGIPEYWRKKFQEEGSAMAKQLRYPTF